MKKPWNLPSLPVFSVLTEYEGQINMNICTYVSAISMNPKRYIIGIYENTKTLFNVTQGSPIVLQLLAENQYPVVRNFGLKSGMNFDKHGFLNRKNSGDLSNPQKAPYELINWRGYQVLRHAAAWIECKPIWNKSAGDHELFLVDVTAYKTNSSLVLTTNILRDKKIIRI